MKDPSDTPRCPVRHRYLRPPVGLEAQQEEEWLTGTSTHTSFFTSKARVPLNLQQEMRPKRLRNLVP